MPTDALFLSALRGELSAAVTGARIDKIHQPAKSSLILVLRGEKNVRLFVWAGASPRVYLSSADYENPAEPPMFCMLLRKYLTGARVLSVTQPALDRVLSFDLAVTDMFGQGAKRRLIIELLGRSPNVILTDGEGIITDCLYRAGSLGEKRAVLPGLRYAPPPQLGKTPPAEADASRFRELFESAPGDGEIQKWICDVFAGISPLIAREIAFRAYGETDARAAASRGRDGGEALFKTWADFRRTLDGGMRPYIIRDPDGEPMDITYMPVLQYGPKYAVEERESFSAALEEFYSRREQEERRRQRASSLIKVVRTRRDRVARRLAAQEKELLAAGEREAMRENGDLLTSSLHLMKKGMSSFEAEDYYKGGTREIKLDPLKTPQQNAAKYYKEYTKARTAETYLTKLVAEGRDELDYLDSVTAELAMAAGAGDVAEIRAELEDAGVVKSPAGGKKRRPKASGVMSFTSPAGVKILVGKNNVQNDLLTFKTARRDDIWLHALKLHGSHVIICCAGGEPDEETLVMAASAAAYYSEGRDGGKTAVDYTRVKYVKKPAGARPGAVIYTEQKTVFALPKEPESVKGE